MSGKGLKRLSNNRRAVSGIVLRGETRISAHVLNPGALYHAWRPGRQSQAKEGGNQGYRNTFPFDFLCYRCAATITGPSRGDHDRGSDTGFPELPCYLLTHLLAVCHRSADSASREKRIVDATNLTVILQFTH